MHYIIKLLLLSVIFLNGKTLVEIDDTTQNNKEINLIEKNLKLIEKNKSYETDSFLVLAKNTLELSKKNNYRKGVVKCYLYIADIFKIKNLNDSAILYYEQGLIYAKYENNNEQLADLYWNLSNIYRLTGNFSSSLEYSLNLKFLVENYNISKYSYKVYNLLALSYQNLMEYDLAKEFFEKSAQLAFEQNDSAYAGIVYANIGRLRFEQGNYNEALDFFQKGVKLEEKFKLYANIGNSYTVIADIFLNLNLLDSARYYLFNATELHKKANNRGGLTHTLLGVSKYYLLCEKYDDALLHADLTIKYANEFNFRSTLSEAYLVKAKILAAKNQFKLAYNAYEEFYSIYSKLYDVEKINQAKALEQKLIQQEKESDLYELELKKQETINNLLILIVVLIIFLGTIVSVYLFKFKKLNKELVISKNKAEESDKLKSRFLQTISHEIRTPLNGIIGFSEMIRTKSLNEEEMVQINDMINKNSDDLISTIENLVDIAHISTNQFEIKKTKFQLIPLLENILDIANESIIFRNKKKLKLKLDKSVDVELYNDKNILQKILLHLVKNAILYTEKGSVTIGYKKENLNLLLFVKDTGIGIPKEKIDIIFSPFQQADEIINIKVGGTGLGLTIVNGLIQMLGGKIWVGSELKKGSTFYISLPLN